jgi:hypothetical protein
MQGLVNAYELAHYVKHIETCLFRLKYSFPVTHGFHFRIPKRFPHVAKEASGDHFYFFVAL